MSTFYLIRHGDHDWLHGGRLAGRIPGVHLNQRGHLQAQAIAAFLRKRAIRRLLSSPLERARETAEPIAAASGLTLEISEALNEVEVGEFTGRSFDELNLLPGWQQWNSQRSLARLPGGERMQEVQTRVTGEMERLRREASGDSLALIFHGDPIRAALLGYLGMHLDQAPVLEISPGSVTELVVEDGGIRLLSLNFQPLDWVSTAVAS